MDAAEVVEREMQADSRGEVLDLLAEALVRRVNRRMLIRMVRFCRSTWLVLMCAGSGLPLIRVGIASKHSPGLYRERLCKVKFDLVRPIHLLYCQTAQGDGPESNRSSPGYQPGALAIELPPPLCV